MAESDNSGQNITNTFTKGLNKDSDPTFIDAGMWTHARNAVNNTSEGDLGTLSNEASNFLCAVTGETMQSTVIDKYIIGCIQIFSDKWLIFTAGHDNQGRPIMSEIGLLQEDRCIYQPVVQDACLRFDKRYLISGVSREKEDCTWQVYFADGLNPDRFLNVGDPQTWIPTSYTYQGSSSAPALVNYYTNGVDSQLWPGVEWFQDCLIDSNNCEFCTNTNVLNCDDIRLARFMTTPCITITPGSSGGTLRNGTYYACIAYSIKGQKVSDYFSASNTQPIWSPDDLQGSLRISISADSENFDEFILVVVQNINQGTVAKQIGFYSTNTSVVELDQIKEDLITVPVSFLPIQTPIFEKSDQIAQVNNYLLRIGPTSKFDFNYQPLANLIKAKWASVVYPADYYIKGGGKGSYLRDEVYTFFIRWVYDTGDKSSSYHIPGRAPIAPYLTYPSEVTLISNASAINTNSLTTDDTVFEVFNTATQTSIVSSTLPDGGVVIARGNMGYWESTENYPDKQPDIWNSSSQCWTNVPPSNVWDLCGKPIRHHKFPDNALSSETFHFTPNLATATQNNLNQIRLMGVYFENIIYPKDNDGNDIPGIVGYEILRGSREGNKSIIAKGMLNNLRTFVIKGDVAIPNQSGLYPNYPFNTITPPSGLPSGSGGLGGHVNGFNDPYIRIPVTTGAQNNQNPVLNQTVPDDMMTFHSPDTMFRTPFLSVTELKLYGQLRGTSSHQFVEPSDHPMFKLLSDTSTVVMIVGGLIEAILSMVGRDTVSQPSGSFDNDVITQKVNKRSGGAITNTVLPTGNFVFPLVTPAVSAGVIFPGTINTSQGGGDTVDVGVGYNDWGENSAVAAINTTYEDDIDDYYQNGGELGVLLGFPSLEEINIKRQDALRDLRGGKQETVTYTKQISKTEQAIGKPASNLYNGLGKFAFYFSEGADATKKLIMLFIKFKQYAVQSIAHGFYGNFVAEPSANIFRYSIEDAFYIRDNIQEVPLYQDSSGAFQSYTINNLKRSDSVVIRTENGQAVTDGPNFINADNSLVTLGTLIQTEDNLGNPINQLPTFENTGVLFQRSIASHYAGIKVRIRNQYGQLDGIKQIPITPCEQKITFDVPTVAGLPVPENNFNTLPQSTNCDTIFNPVTGSSQLILKTLTQTPIFFGGDTFINRYTEKNTFFYYYDWLWQQPDGYEFNYALHNMIPSSRFFVNSIEYDPSPLAPTFANIPSWFNVSNPGTGFWPRDFYQLDWYTGSSSSNHYNYSNDDEGNYGTSLDFSVPNAKFYLFNSSVRDFFVESDVLVDFREQGITEGEKHYDANRYTDLIRMFNTDPAIITRGNEYRYDYSLSISKAFTQYFSQGSLQSRYYNPKVSQLCYTYYPDRIYYSLPQQDESFKDSWFIYLANNYKEFKSQINSAKSINKSGILLTFKNDGPLMFQGTDQLQTDLGTKLTIGDGGLFSQPGQAITNADISFEYGSSQNRLSVINTPVGLFYISQNQGKILSYGEGLTEISQKGLKWWFNLFLPYKLTDDFPDYPWQDNPVAGIGCQSIYDNENSILYFCKKDYRLRKTTDPIPRVPGIIAYVPLITFGKDNGKGDYFTLNGQGRYLLGDPLLFEDASWTVSFDPKSATWISYHDWHPSLSLNTKGVFLTTGDLGKQNTIWKHNFICNNFCNFYDTPYPFEIEFPHITGQTVTTIRSFEYILECYKRSSINCVDQFKILDYNFDKVVVFNNEQVSGYLNLNIFPKNNVTLSLTYPKLNTTNFASYDILFSKEESKYRFNQFWDITADRGEFPVGSGYPPLGPLVPGTTVLSGNYIERNIWITDASGYKKILNPTNLNYAKPPLERKKFRSYLNFLNLTRNAAPVGVVNDVNMIIKVFDVKIQISER
jgi:hypothetical protein